MNPIEPEETEPPRLRDASTTSPALLAALRAANADLPSPAALAGLAARLGPLLPPPGGPAPGSSAPPPPASPAAQLVSAGGPLAIKLVVGGALVALSVVVASHQSGWIVGPGAEVEDAPRVSIEAPVTETPAPPVEAAPPAPAPPPSGLVPEARKVAPARALPSAAPSAPSAPAAPLAPVDSLEAELTLIRAAQDALHPDPALALALADEHASRYAEGSLAQERELLAVQALLALGRIDQAHARAGRFAARWPTSAHLHRLHVVLDGEK